MNRIFCRLLVTVALGVCSLAPLAAGAADSLPQTPLQPLLAWAVAPDGAVFVLDAAHVIHELDPVSLGPLRRSAPLHESFSATQAYLAATEAELWVGSRLLGKTLRLDRLSLSANAEVDQVGELAVDPGRSLFVASEGDHGLWVYGLADLAAPPAALLLPWSESQFSGQIPRFLTVDAGARRLYVTLYNSYGSPPHNREELAAFDLDTLERQTTESYLGSLSRPAVAANTGQVATVFNAKSGLMGSELLILSRAVEVERRTPYLDGQAVLAPDGKWIYLLRRRGLWTLRSEDMVVAGILPIVAEQPAGLLLSPDGSMVYLFGGGWASALPATYLQRLGLPTTGALPTPWRAGEGVSFVYRAPGFDEHSIAFALGQDGELYRSEDGMATWGLALTSIYPQPAWMAHLSLSPRFATDGTVVARPLWGASLLRSTDAGLTWEPWSPRLAFVSDREGNREIYTADGQGADLRRLTDDPAQDENPAWSPAWTRVVFQSDRSGNYDLYSVEAECDQSGAGACAVEQLTTDPADDLLPAWSPDGRLIAFVSLRDGNPEIYVMDSDGANPRRLTHNPTGDWRPAWMPDSRHILFTSDRSGTNDLYLVPVPAPGGYWNPDVEPAVRALIATAADERDPAVNALGDVLFVSDHQGDAQVWQTPAVDPDSFEAVAEPYGAYNYARLAGSHPSWLDRGGSSQIVMSVEGDMGLDIVSLSYIGAETADRLIASPGFDGQPAGGPVWWESRDVLPAP